MNKMPDEVKDKLLLPAIKAFSAPYSADPIELYYEVHKRVEAIVEKAYAAGYAQRDAEIMIGNINHE